MHSRRKKTFTLIEMLIVIVIIGILAAALIPRLQAVQGRARDSQRKTDFRTIYNANEIFLLDNGKYARPGTGNYNDTNYVARSIQVQPWITDLSGVLTSIPVDPLNTHVGGAFSPTGAYHYSYTRVYQASVAGVHTYDLWAKLENTNDSDRNQVKRYYTDYPAVITPTGGDYTRLYDVSPNVTNSFY